MREVVVVCGQGRAVNGLPPDALRLDLEGECRNVSLRVSDLTKRVVKDLPAPVADLLEVATYVYAADLSTSRGGPVSQGMGRDWRRDFRFVIPVREPDLWNTESVQTSLCKALAFLSDDGFEFEFVSKHHAEGFPSYLELGDKGVAFEPDEIIMFSGGLDSLAGAVQQLSTTRNRMVLVSHRPSSKIYEHQKKLVSDLRSAFPKRLMHVPVIANRMDPLEVHEFTQRTRSFLYIAFSSAIASILGIDRVRFFENGIVSMNLPLAEQVVGARATRTTHPLALALLGRALSVILDAHLEIENPFLWTTKADVVRKIVDTGFAHLIEQTVSCSHVHEMTREHTHCGRCSQCIDRRFGILAADAAQHDPASRYALDLLEGERKEGVDRTMAEAFVRTRVEMSRMNDMDYLGKYGAEIATICGSVAGLTASEAGSRIVGLHQRHGEEVSRVLENSVAAHSRDLVRRALPASSILMMAIARPAEHPSTPSAATWKSNATSSNGGSPVARRFRGRAKPSRERAEAALNHLFPLGIPPQADITNGMLCSAVANWLRSNRKPQVSDDTVLRAAGRRN